MSDPTPNEEKLGIYDTAQDSKRLGGKTLEELLVLLADVATVKNSNALGGVSAEELINELKDPKGKVLDAERLSGRTLEDITTEVKDRIREASNPFMTFPMSKGGWSRLVTIPNNYANSYSDKQHTIEDLLFILIGGGPYGFNSERPVAYLRFGKEDRPPVLNILSGVYTNDFVHRQVDVNGVAHTEIWFGPKARNDLQMILLGGVRGCQFDVRGTPSETPPEGSLRTVRSETTLFKSYADKALGVLRSEITELKESLEKIKST